MKIMAGLVAVAAMGLSQVAQAQESCEVFEYLIDAAWEDFDAITGEEQADGVYLATYQFEGASQCTVSIDFVAEYGCFYAFGSEAEGAQAYANALGQFEACLPDWSRDESQPEAAGEEFTPLKVMFAAGPGDLGDLEWYLSLDRHNRPEGPDWHLSVGLTYF
jgi:hypothetical protein